MIARMRALGANSFEPWPRIGDRAAAHAHPQDLRARARMRCSKRWRGQDAVGTRIRIRFALVIGPAFMPREASAQINRERWRQRRQILHAGLIVRIEIAKRQPEGRMSIGEAVLDHVPNRPRFRLPDRATDRIVRSARFQVAYEQADVLAVNRKAIAPKHPGGSRRA